jgi:hypothetical protein
MQKYGVGYTGADAKFTMSGAKIYKRSVKYSLQDNLFRVIAVVFI